MFRSNSFASSLIMFRRSKNLSAIFSARGFGLVLFGVRKRQKSRTLFMILVKSSALVNFRVSTGICAALADVLMRYVRLKSITIGTFHDCVRCFFTPISILVFAGQVFKWHIKRYNFLPFMRVMAFFRLIFILRPPYALPRATRTSVNIFILSTLQV